MGNYWLDVEKLKCQEELMETHKRLSGRELLRSDPWRGLPETFTGDMREYQNRMLNASTPICEFREETVHHEEFGEIEIRRVHEVGQLTTRNLLQQAWNSMCGHPPHPQVNPDMRFVGSHNLPAEGYISSGNWRSVEERRNTVHTSAESTARCKAYWSKEEHPLTQDERHGRGEWRDG